MQAEDAQILKDHGCLRVIDTSEKRGVYYYEKEIYRSHDGFFDVSNDADGLRRKLR